MMLAATKTKGIATKQQLIATSRLQTKARHVSGDIADMKDKRRDEEKEWKTFSEG